MAAAISHWRSSKHFSVQFCSPGRCKLPPGKRGSQLSAAGTTCGFRNKVLQVQLGLLPQHKQKVAQCAGEQYSLKRKAKIFLESEFNSHKHLSISTPRTSSRILFNCRRSFIGTVSWQGLKNATAKEKKAFYFNSKGRRELLRSWKHLRCIATRWVEGLGR